MDAYLLLAALLLLAGASVRFGLDSRPGINAKEEFFAFHGHHR